MLTNMVATLNGKGGVGKALAVEEPVITPTGERRIGDLVPGDLVMGSDGLPYEVLGVYPQGIRDLYDVTFSDGTIIRADADHIWEVQTSNDRGRTPCAVDGCDKRVTAGGLCRAHYGQNRRGSDLAPIRAGDYVRAERTASGNRTFTTIEMLEAGVGIERPGRGKRHKFFVPVCAPLKFPAADLPVDPWLLGMLLGDGSLKHGGVGLTTADQETVDRAGLALSKFPRLRLHQVDRYEYRICREAGVWWSDGELLTALKASDARSKEEYKAWRASNPDAPGADVITRRFGSHAQARDDLVGADLPDSWSSATDPRNPLLSELQQLGMLGRGADDKFVPAVYKYADADARLAVLQGLFDADGWAAKTAVGFSTASERLADDVQYIAQSLGCVVTRSTKTPRYIYQGESREGRLAYVLRIKPSPGVDLFKLSRKKDMVTEGQRRPYRAIESIKPAGSGEAVCIEVASPDHLFLARNCVPTHNTTAAAHLAGIAAAKGWRTLAIDLDGQGNLHRSLGFEYDDGVHLRDAMLGEVDLEPRPDRRENLFYVGGGNQIEKAVAALQSEASQGDPAILYRIQKMVSPVADEFDLIVVDSPPREMFLRRMILTASRFVVIPVDKDEGTFDGIASVMRSIGEAREYGNPALEVLAALRFKMVSQKMADETKAEVEAMIGDGLVLDSWIRNALRAAADLREDSLLAHEYDQAAQQAVPWWKRRTMAPEEKKAVKQYSSAAAGLSDDWLGAVSEILSRFAERSQAAEGVA